MILSIGNWLGSTKYTKAQGERERAKDEGDEKMGGGGDKLFDADYCP